MDDSSNAFNKYVVGSVLADNKFEITDVKDIESIKTLNYDPQLYKKIENLILEGRVDELKLLTRDVEKPFEFLEIMIFKDQSNNNYVVTVYDSLLLEQDPEVINIFPLKQPL